jgi:hypothetical protein
MDKLNRENVVALADYREQTQTEVQDSQAIVQDSQAIESMIQAHVVVDKPKAKRKPKAKADPSTFMYPALATQGLPIANLLHRFINLGETKGGVGKFRFEGNTFVHRTYKDYGATEVLDVVAQRIFKADGKPMYVGNSSILRGVGQSAAFGRVRSNRSETAIQRFMATFLPMIPFSVFVEAKLDLNEMQLVDRGPEQTVVRNRTEWKNNREVKTKEKVHFTGASLFKVGKEYFLFDIDRNEIEHGIFNAFLVNLAKPAKTIEAAYEALKPNEVKQAESKGLEVLRQGEWFFIPVDKRTNSKLDKLSSFKGELALRAGNNRPNQTKGIEFLKNGKPVPVPKVGKGKDADVENGWDIDRWRQKKGAGRKGNTVYVTDFSKHSGREHKDLVLKRWYTVVPNTSTRSFQINGDID